MPGKRHRGEAQLPTTASVAIIRLLPEGLLEVEMDYHEYPRFVVEDIARLRRRIQASGMPGKLTDGNLLVGTWNVRAFGEVYPRWEENPGSPKRNLRALAYLVEIMRRYDVIALQEVKRDLSGVRLLLEWLGPDWGMIVTDVTLGEEGNTERLAFVFDRRRVQPSGLAGEVVLPPGPQGEPARQFSRTPYAVGFRAGSERFVLVTAHIRYGSPEERTPEITALAGHVAREIRNRVVAASAEEENLIVLGDFNIDKRSDDPNFQAFVSTGLWLPPQLEHLRTATGSTPKFYDQIAWFRPEFDLRYTDCAGVIDFAGTIYPELSLQEMSFRVSDHLPLWVEFNLDRSAEKMAPALGLNPDMPDPLGSVPDNPPG
jgi:endonuclease/exonuclease/phosphatase family metal-dependent hydrolase